MSVSGLTDELVLQMRRECRNDPNKDAKYFSTLLKISKHTVDKAIRGNTFSRLNTTEAPVIRNSFSITDEVVIECRRRVRLDHSVKNRDLAKEFNIPMATLEHAIRGDHYGHLNDIEPPVKRVVSKDELRSESRQLYIEGKSFRDLQRILGVSKSSLSLWLKDIVRPAKGAGSSIVSFPAESPYLGFTVFVSESPNGDVRYRVENKETKVRYLLTRIRYNMSVSVGRILTSDEIVIRKEQGSDEIDNLELLTKTQYSLKRKKDRTTKCVECKKKFVKNHSTTRTCSKTCTIAFRERKKLNTLGKKIRKCKECNGDFTSVAPHAKFCSPTCHNRNATKIRATKRIENTPVKHTIECVICGNEFKSLNLSAEICHRKKCIKFMEDRDAYEKEKSDLE